MTPAGWRDPLYRPRREFPDSAEEQELAGVRVAVAVTDTDPASAEAQWSADRDVTLFLLDPDPGSDAAADGSTAPERLAEVLAAFLTLATQLADRPSRAGISLPSRDVDRARVVRGAGLYPTGVLAVADLRRPVPPADAARPDVVVRDAGPDDVDAVARLWCEQADFEARVGTLRTSDAIRAAIAVSAGQAIAGASEVLLAEVDGRATGALVAQTVEDSQWTTSRLTVEPAAYLAMASTTDAARGGGVGAALAAELHRRHRADGLLASTLHYSAYNPLSVPFWSQQGYRPLVTSYGATVRR